MRFTVPLSAVAAAVLLVGCGGGGAATNSQGPRSPNAHDQQIANRVVQKMGALYEEAIPLYACGSDCNRAALRRLRSDARVASNQTADQAAGVEAPCLRRAMTTLAASLGALQAYADASLARSNTEADTALSRSDDLRLAAQDRLVRCGYVKRGQSIGLEVNLAYRKVDQAASGIGRCKTRACFATKGRAIKRAADQGLVRIARFNGSLQPACLRGLVATARAYLTAWSRFGSASMKLDAKVMQTEANRANGLAVKLSRGVKNCAS